MSILISTEIMDGIKRELQSAINSVQIISAYCKEDSFRTLESFISDSVLDKKLLVRFRLDDILKHSTDFGVLESAMEFGWKVFVRFDLHAKTYIVDNKRCFVGSANTTNRGLGIGRTGNVEMATLVDIEGADLKKIQKLFNDAIEVNQDIITKMKVQLEQVKTGAKTKEYSWDSSILNLFTPKVETLFSYELPNNSSLNQGEYISFLDMIYDGDEKRFKEAFRWSNAYVWLIDMLKSSGGTLYFGELTAKLHEAMVTDPKPYRKDVKIMLSNLLSLINESGMEEITIDRPNYSQRIMLKQ